MSDALGWISLAVAVLSLGLAIYAYDLARMTEYKVRDAWERDHPGKEFPF